MVFCTDDIVEFHLPFQVVFGESLGKGYGKHAMMQNA
jgi:hypothetical protein